MRAFGDVYLADNAVLTGDVVLAVGVNVWFGCVLRGDLARITLGPNVNLQDGCLVHTDTDAPQDIEAGVVAGHAAVLHGRRVGAETLVGIGARLLAGSNIGEGCIIAAGCVVPERTTVPPDSLVMGVPGKVVRPVTPAERERTRLIAVHYLALAQRYARGEIARPFGRPLPGTARD